MNVCSSRESAVSQHHCTAALLKGEYVSYCSVLQDRLTDGLLLCKITCANLLVIQMGNDSEPVLLSTDLDQTG